MQELRVTRAMPTRVSVSQAKHWDECRRRWAYRHAWDLPVSSPQAYRFGNAVHAALAAGYDVLRRALPGTTASRVREAALEALGIEWERLEVDWEQDYESAQTATLTAFTDERVTEHLDRSDVEAIEQRFTETLLVPDVDGVVTEVAVSGIIDLVLRDPTTGTYEIRDHKLGRRRPTAVNDQLLVYAAAWESSTGIRTLRISLWYPKDAALVSADVDVEQQMRALRWLARVRGEIADAWPLHDWPASPGYGCQWCDHRQVCPYSITDEGELHESDA